MANQHAITNNVVPSIDPFPKEMVLEIVKATGSSYFLVVNRAFNKFAYTLLSKDPRITKTNTHTRLSIWCRDINVLREFIKYHFDANLNIKLYSYPQCCSNVICQESLRVVHGNVQMCKVFGHSNYISSPCLFNNNLFTHDSAQRVLACWLQHFWGCSNDRFLLTFLEEVSALDDKRKFFLLTRIAELEWEYAAVLSTERIARLCRVLTFSTWFWKSVCNPRHTCAFDTKTRITMTRHYRATENETIRQVSERFPCRSGRLLRLLALFQSTDIQWKMQQHWNELCSCLRTSPEVYESVFGPFVTESKEGTSTVSWINEKAKDSLTTVATNCTIT